jgi:hypothetical protein
VLDATSVRHRSACDGSGGAAPIVAGEPLSSVVGTWCMLGRSAITPR